MMFLCCRAKCISTRKTSEGVRTADTSWLCRQDSRTLVTGSYLYTALSCMFTIVHAIAIGVVLKKGQCDDDGDQVHACVFVSQY